MVTEEDVKRFRLNVGQALRKLGSVITGLGMIADPRDPEKIIQDIARQKMDEVMQNSEGDTAVQHGVDSSTPDNFGDLFPESDEGFDLDDDEEDDEPGAM